MSSIASLSDSLQTLILKQLEVNFSDMYLRYNQSMKTLLKNDCHSWVPIDTLMTTNGFHLLKPMINNNKNLLIRVLKTKKSDLIELSPNGDQIRRRIDRPLPQTHKEFEESFDERTVLLKGIPKDTTLDELMEWTQQLGPILEVRFDVRLKANKQFNGYAFVTFANKESAEKVVNQSILKLKDSEISKKIKSKAKTNKKRKSLVKAMKSISINSTEGTVDKSLSLDDLPNETLIKIFNYLECEEVNKLFLDLFSFFSRGHRFVALLHQVEQHKNR